MTVKERLHELVDALSDEQAEQAERTLARFAGGPGAPARRAESSFVGKFASGHADTSHRVDEILAQGFGR